MINIKDLDSSLLITDRKNIKNIGIYHIRFNLIKKFDVYENIHSVNPLYLVINKADGKIEDTNGNKYLSFAFTDKDVLAKYRKVWDKIKYLIKTIYSGKAGEYEKIS